MQDLFCIIKKVKDKNLVYEQLKQRVAAAKTVMKFCFIMDRVHGFMMFILRKSSIQML